MSDEQRHGLDRRVSAGRRVTDIKVVPWSLLQRVALVVLVLLVVWLAAQSLAVSQRNQQLLRENTRLSGKVQALTNEIGQLRRVIEQLSTQVVALGGTPVALPPPVVDTTTTTAPRRSTTTTRRAATPTTARPNASPSTSAPPPATTAPPTVPPATTTTTACPTPTVPVAGCPGHVNQHGRTP